MERLITKTCYKCNGAGVWIKDTPVGPEEYDPCPICLGAKTTTMSYNELPTNVFDAHVVLEEIDITEYNVLTDAQKDGVKMLLSCGIIDLNSGKAGKTRIWNWFGTESTTVANLTGLLTELPT